jgi:hypothetical protein
MRGEQHHCQAKAEDSHKGFVGNFSMTSLDNAVSAVTEACDLSISIETLWAPQPPRKCEGQPEVYAGRNSFGENKLDNRVSFSK